MKCFAVGCLSLWLISANAATTNLPCVADTTLSESYPDNNLGGLTHVAAGTTQNVTRNRGLFRFDIAGAVPAGSQIQSAALVLEVTLAPSDGVPFADFESASYPS